SPVLEGLGEVEVPGAIPLTGAAIVVARARLRRLEAAAPLARRPLAVLAVIVAELPGTLPEAGGKTEHGHGLVRRSGEGAESGVRRIQGEVGRERRVRPQAGEGIRVRPTVPPYLVEVCRERGRAGRLQLGSHQELPALRLARIEAVLPVHRNQRVPAAVDRV